jgi:thioredoxin 1
MWKGLIRQLVCWTSQHRAPTPQDIDALDDATLDMLGVETIPTFLLMRRGNEAARLSGVAHKRPAKPLAAAIRKHLLQ